MILDAEMPRPSPLYITEAECAARVGVSLDEWKSVVPKLEKARLPMPSELFQGKRYWPAVREFFDKYERRPKSLTMPDPLAGMDIGCRGASRGRGNPTRALRVTRS